MQNILQIQDDLKNFSQQQLVAAMQNPTGGAPQFLVLSELNRRKRVKEEQQRQEAANQMTVAEEAVMAAGMPPAMTGQMAKAMAPKSNVAENTGIAAMAPKQPTRMAEGGVVKMKTGGLTAAIAQLKVNYPEVYEMYKEKPEELEIIAMQMMESAKDPELTGLEQLEKPRTTFEKIKDFAKYSPLKARKNMEKIEEGNKERELQGQIATASKLRSKTDDDPIFAEGTPIDPLTGNFKFPRTPSQVGNPMLEGPKMGSDISSSDLSVSTSNAVDPLASLLAPEAQRLGTALVRPKAPQGPDMSGVEADMAQDQLRKFIATEDPQFYGPEAKAMGQRAREFYNTDTYVPPEMIYSGDARDIAKREEASEDEIQAISDRLAKEATADESKKELEYLDKKADEEGLGPDAAKALREGALRTLQDQTQPTLVEGVNVPKKDQSLLVDAGEAAVKGVGKAFEFGKDNLKPFLNEALDADKAVRGKISDYLFGDPVKSESQDNQPQTEEGSEAKTNSQQALEKIIENQKKQAEKANMTLSEYLKGLEKDRESSKWLALARAGAELMKPSASFGEGLGKAATAGLKSLQKDRKDYNKSKLQLLALQGRIDAAKAAASSRAGIAQARLQTAALSDERDQLQAQLDMALMMTGGDAPDAKASIKIKELQRKIADLNNQIRTASGLSALASVGGGGDIFGSYDLTTG